MRDVKNEIIFWTMLRKWRKKFNYGSSVTFPDWSDSSAVAQSYRMGGQAWWGVGREGTWVVFVQNDSMDQGLIKTFVDYWLEQICEAREAYGPVHVRGLQTSGLTRSNVSFSSCFQTLYCVQTLDYLRHGYHKNTYWISESDNPPSVALSALQNL